MVNESCTLNTGEIEGLAEQICSSGWIGHGAMSLSFQLKANRDAVYFAATRKGAGMKRGSIRGQLLDPRYTVEGRHLPDLGLGNDKEYFGALYTLERVA